MSTDVGTWTNWLTFEPDPDYNPDAGTRLLSPISYVLQRGILLCRENPTYRYWAPVAAVRRGFKMVLFTASRGSTFVGGKMRSECPSSYYYNFLACNIGYEWKSSVCQFVCSCVCDTRIDGETDRQTQNRYHWSSVVRNVRLKNQLHMNISPFAFSALSWKLGFFFNKRYYHVSMAPSSGLGGLRPRPVSSSLYQM